MKEKCITPPPTNEVAPRVSHLSRMLRHSLNEAIKEEGLFSGQHHIILVLKENQPATISEIADMLGVSNASISVSIKRMEKAGFVTKKRNKKDARIIELQLTDKGNAVPEHIRSKMAIENEKLTRGMTQEEIHLLSNLLDKGIKNLKGE